MHLYTIWKITMEESTSTDTESVTEASSSHTKKKTGNHWYLSQKNRDEPSTDKSDIENYDEAEDEIFRKPKKAPSMAALKDYSSKVSYSMDKTSGPPSDQQRQPKIDVPLKNESDFTDDDELEITATEFLKILQEELNSRGQAKLKLKAHQTTVSLKKTNWEARIPKKCQVRYTEDDTDCSDVDVSMMDYYAIRHQNQSTIHKKKVKASQKFVETDDSDLDINSEPLELTKAKKQANEGSSDTSDLEVNMKDYYVIRHETAPKCVYGPFEIDFGQTTLQCSSLKKQKKKSKVNLVPIVPALDNDKSTDDEDIICRADELTFKDLFFKEFDLRKSKSASTECQNHAEKSDLDDTSEEEDDESSDEPSENTECEAEDLSVSCVSSKPNSLAVKKEQPIIRLVEIDGCQGAVGVICGPKSPTRDNVHGIMFLDSTVSQVDLKTEEFENISEAEEDAEMMEKGNFEPATDDEELSDLELDSSKAPAHHVLPECRKKMCTIKTSLDGKTLSTESMVKLDQTVSLSQFVHETEQLSESDVCDWSEEEARIARRMSGDFGKLKKATNGSTLSLLDQKEMTKSSTKKGRARKRGRKKPDATGIGGRA